MNLGLAFAALGALGAIWYFWRALTTGVLPLRPAWSEREVSRRDMPATFWIMVGMAEAIAACLSWLVFNWVRNGAS